MKRILAVFFNCNSVIRIMITALLAAASQPLIAWSMAGLSGAFLENDLIYVTVFRNILILLLADDERIVIHIAHNSSPKYQERYDAVVRLAIQNAPGE